MDRVDNKPQISVIIPVFNEADNLRKLYVRLKQVLDTIGKKYELIYVDDGSKDSSYKILKELQKNDESINVIRFTRNFGQHPAVSAGFNNANGEVIITLDADLQNPPEEIPKLLSKLDEGYDVVTGWRENRNDPFIRRVASRIENWIIAKLTGVKLKDYGCMLRVYKKEVIDKLKLFKESCRFITALVSWLGVSIAEVKIKHNPRFSGKSKYNYLKLITMNFDLITGFSMAPIQIVSLFGILISVMGFVLGFILIIWRIIYGSGISGVVTFLAFIFIFFGIQLIALGLIGEYIARIYIEAKKRPYYLIK